VVLPRGAVLWGGLCRAPGPLGPWCWILTRIKAMAALHSVHL
jgi:hypothetical protein